MMYCRLPYWRNKRRRWWWWRLMMMIKHSHILTDTVDSGGNSNFLHDAYVSRYSRAGGIVQPAKQKRAGNCHWGVRDASEQLMINVSLSCTNATAISSCNVYRQQVLSHPIRALTRFDAKLPKISQGDGQVCTRDRPYCNQRCGSGHDFAAATHLAWHRVDEIYT